MFERLVEASNLLPLLSDCGEQESNMLLPRTFAALILLAPIALLPRTHAFTAPTPFVRHAPACNGGPLRGQGSPSLCGIVSARTRPPLSRLRMAESGGLPSTLG